MKGMKSFFRPMEKNYIYRILLLCYNPFPTWMRSSLSRLLCWILIFGIKVNSQKDRFSNFFPGALARWIIGLIFSKPDSPDHFFYIQTPIWSYVPIPEKVNMFQSGSIHSSKFLGALLAFNVGQVPFTLAVELVWTFYFRRSGDIDPDKQVTHLNGRLFAREPVIIFLRIIGGIPVTQVI